MQIEDANAVCAKRGNILLHVLIATAWQQMPTTKARSMCESSQATLLLIIYLYFLIIWLTILFLSPPQPILYLA